ncbi:hypothetical protein, partial [Kitasatospora acidiphila]|uniref:hypothetical protein n=1 Tax=Kitasatospora acidiphila TaxID=2567942 RepID=UPI003C73741A
MAEPVRVRRLTDREGRQLQRIVRRGSTISVRYRRAERHQEINHVALLHLLAGKEPAQPLTLIDEE